MFELGRQGGGLGKLGFIKMSLASGGLRLQTPFIYRITDIHLLQMLAFHLSLRLFTILLVNNVTFCQTNRFKINNGCESMYMYT